MLKCRKFLVQSIVGLTAAYCSYGFSLPNPASVYCLDVGGQLKLISSESGQSAVCSFGNAIIEQWTLYDASFGSQSQAVEAYLNQTTEDPQLSMDIGYPNPAYVACSKAGGTYNDQYETSAGLPIALCSFADLSAIEVWTLLGGPNHPDNADLTRILRKQDSCSK